MHKTVVFLHKMRNRALFVYVVLVILYNLFLFSYICLLRMGGFPV